MDGDFLRVSLRHHTREHEHKCLCEACRARMYFDLVLENKRLRSAIDETVEKVRRAVTHCAETEQSIPSGLSRAIDKLNALESAINRYLPDISVREEVLEVDLDSAQVRSLLDAQPVERDGQKAFSAHGSSIEALYQKSEMMPWQDLKQQADHLERSLGLPSRENRPQKGAVTVGESRISSLLDKIA